MSNDISSEYTKMKNINDGRKGYGFWKHEKVDIISPKNYGIFKINKKKRR